MTDDSLFFTFHNPKQNTEEQQYDSPISRNEYNGYNGNIGVNDQNNGFIERLEQ
jgi:hypothetical protein